MLYEKLMNIGSSRGFVIPRSVLKLLDIQQAGLILRLHINRKDKLITVTKLNHTAPLDDIDATYDVKLLKLGSSFAFTIPAKELAEFGIEGVGRKFKVDVDTKHGELTLANIVRMTKAQMNDIRYEEAMRQADKEKRERRLAKKAKLND